MLSLKNEAQVNKFDKNNFDVNIYCTLTLNVHFGSVNKPELFNNIKNMFYAISFDNHDNIRKTADNIEKLIDDYSDAGSHSFIEYYLDSYKKTLKNPTLDSDNNGVSDAFEWQNGTIHANRDPQPNNAF